MIYGNHPGSEYNVVTEDRKGRRRDLQSTPSSRDVEGKNDPAKEIEKEEVDRKPEEHSILFKI